MSKAKKNKNIAIQNIGESINYDVIGLLKSENYLTKPNMAIFLKTYVKSIRICISSGKVDIWPKIHYDIGKAIIRFKDNKTLIKCQAGVYLCDGFTDIELTDQHKQLINKFFELLEQYRFIRNGHEDVKVFSTDVEKTNAQMQNSLNCIKDKQPDFVDYTPKISVSSLN